jgi:hypothetical protein
MLANWWKFGIVEDAGGGSFIEAERGAGIF